MIKRMKVYGTIEVGVEKIVEVEVGENNDKDEVIDRALDVAEEEFGGVKGYCGNGGSDKLIGVER